MRSTEALAYEALRRARRAGAQGAPDRGIAVHVHPEVAAFLAANRRRTIDALAAMLARPVEVVAEAGFEREQVEVVVG